MGVDWVIIPGYGFVNSEIPGGAEIEDSQLLFKAITVCVEFVLVVEVCSEAQADFFTNVVIDGDAVKPCLDLKTIVFNIILPASEIKFGQSGRAFQHDDKCLGAFNCVDFLETGVLFCRVTGGSENVCAILLP